MAAGIALGALLLAAGLSPLALTLLPNPVPVRISDPAAQVDGVYVGTPDAIFHVFPYPESVGEFPQDALATAPGAAVWVKYSALSDLADYTIRTFANGVEVPSARSTATPRVLEIRPSRELAPGRYVAEVPRDSLLGGTDYVYFSVEAAANATTSAP
jgi:hypothetical protein